MTRARITTPNDQDMKGLSPVMKRWVIEMTRSATGGIEGDDRLSGIVQGTKPLTDVTIADLGSIKTQLEAQATNQAASTAASSAATGALSATADVSAVYGQGPVGALIETGNVTITATGGTAPYTFAWTKQSGDTVTVNTVSEVSPTIVTKFSETGVSGGHFNGTYCCTVTDSASATFDVCVPVYITTLSVDGRSFA